MEQITSRWETMTYTVLDIERFPLLEMQNLLKDTYQVLIKYHENNFIPKEISKILLKMDGFLYFTSLMENKEVGIDFYHYQYISSIVTALKKGFFEAEYDCDFPQLKILHADKNEVVIDFEADIFSK